MRLTSEQTYALLARGGARCGLETKTRLVSPQIQALVFTPRGAVPIAPQRENEELHAVFCPKLARRLLPPANLNPTKKLRCHSSRQARIIPGAVSPQDFVASF